MVIILFFFSLLTYKVQILDKIGFRRKLKIMLYLFNNNVYKLYYELLNSQNLIVGEILSYYNLNI